jgi:hypothetical protein
MNKQLEIVIDESGDCTSIYDDSMNDLYKALGTAKIDRASDVEWESGGWTVRSHKNPTKALRIVDGCVTVSTEGPIAYFESREEALSSEIANFWKLL